MRGTGEKVRRKKKGNEKGKRGERGRRIGKRRKKMRIKWR